MWSPLSVSNCVPVVAISIGSGGVGGKRALVMINCDDEVCLLDTASSGGRWLAADRVT